MSLTTALEIGRSALSASQLGIQITGNNTANAATPGYARQIMRLTPLTGQTTGGVGAGSGKGVSVRDVQRQIDEALNTRTRAGLSDEAAASAILAQLSTLESTLGELSGNDLSSQLSSFFNAWSERGNLTKSSAIVVQKGAALADYMKSLRSDLTGLRDQVDVTLGQSVSSANSLLSQIAQYNIQVSAAEIDGSTANALRDQRDQALTDLAQLMDITVVPQNNGTVDVLVGSSPVVLGTQTRGLQFTRETVNGSLQAFIRTTTDGQSLPVTSGAIGGLIKTRGGPIDDTIASLDTVASQLIFQINKLHSTGTNQSGVTSTTGNLQTALADRTLPMNDPLNGTFASLPIKPTTGGFTINVKQTGTGAVTTVRINVDLDNITSAGLAGTADDTTPEQIRAALDAVPGVNAQFTSDGKLKVAADSGFEFSFSDDTSGVPALMGLNAYFKGTTAKDIALDSTLSSDPTRLLVGKLVKGQFVENANAIAIAGLQTQANTALGGQSIRGAWTDTAQSVGVQTAAATASAKSATVVRESLEAQRSGVSGVSIDEESINLLNYQRQYQAAARLISVTDELTQQLINLV
jgi:flagellar hook-associated protein 1